MAVLFTKKQLALATTSACVVVGRFVSYIEYLKFSSSYDEILVTLLDFKNKDKCITINLLNGEENYGYYSYLLVIYNILITNDSFLINKSFSQVPFEVLEEFKAIVHREFDFNY